MGGKWFGLLSKILNKGFDLESQKGLTTVWAIRVPRVLAPLSNSWIILHQLNNYI